MHFAVASKLNEHGFEDIKNTLLMETLIHNWNEQCIMIAMCSVIHVLQVAAWSQINYRAGDIMMCITAVKHSAWPLSIFMSAQTQSQDGIPSYPKLSQGLRGRILQNSTNYSQKAAHPHSLGVTLLNILAKGAVQPHHQFEGQNTENIFIMSSF